MMKDDRLLERQVRLGDLELNVDRCTCGGYLEMVSTMDGIIQARCKGNLRHFVYFFSRGLANDIYRKVEGL